jgi:tetratricopeptide (TPR) repeat protein
MKNQITLAFFVFILAIPCLPQTPAPVAERNFQLALPSHNGQLQWTASGYRIVEFSAKPAGREIGIRGKDTPGRLTFLGFLFLVNERAPLTSARCRDGALDAMKKANPTTTILTTYQIPDSGSLPVEVVGYSANTGQGKTSYSMRAFTATGDICGDLEFYSEAPISADDGELRKTFSSMKLDLSYVPQVHDVLLYAQILYKHQAFKAAAPIFEEALSKLDGGPEQQDMRRAVTDQAGMSYGISGDIHKARAIFNAAIAKDPDYPLYYYNLACADAEEGKLADARKHLEQAFARKANVIHGESMPDPTKDDSFLPYQKNKDFWAFIENLH